MSGTDSDREVDIPQTRSSEDSKEEEEEGSEENEVTVNKHESNDEGTDSDNGSDYSNSDEEDYNNGDDDNNSSSSSGSESDDAEDNCRTVLKQLINQFQLYKDNVQAEKESAMNTIQELRAEKGMLMEELRKRDGEADRLQAENDALISRTKYLSEKNAHFQREVQAQLEELQDIITDLDMRLKESEASRADMARRLTAAEARGGKAPVVKDCEIRLKVCYSGEAIREITLVPENDEERAAIVLDNAGLKERIVKLEQDLVVARDDLDKSSKSIAELTEENAKIEKKYKHASKRAKNLKKDAAATAITTTTTTPSSLAPQSDEGELYRRVLRIYSTHIMRGSPLEVGIPDGMRTAIFNDIVSKGTPTLAVFECAQKCVSEAIEYGIFREWIECGEWRNALTASSASNGSSDNVEPPKFSDVFSSFDLLASLKRFSDGRFRELRGIIFLADIQDTSKCGKDTAAVSRNLSSISSMRGRLKPLTKETSRSSTRLSPTGPVKVDVTMQQQQQQQQLKPMASLHAQKSIAIKNNIQKIFQNSNASEDDNNMHEATSLRLNSTYAQRQKPPPPSYTSFQQAVRIPTGAIIATAAATVAAGKYTASDASVAGHDTSSALQKDNGLAQIGNNYANGTVTAMSATPNTNEVWVATTITSASSAKQLSMMSNSSAKATTATVEEKSEINTYDITSFSQRASAPITVNAHVNELIAVGKNEMWAMCSDSVIRVYKTHKPDAPLTVLTIGTTTTKKKGVSDALSKCPVTCAAVVGENVWSVANDLSISLWRIKDKKLIKTIRANTALWAIAYPGHDAVWVGTTSGIYFYGPNGKSLGSSGSSSDNGSGNGATSSALERYRSMQVDKLAVVKDTVWAFHSAFGVVSVWDAVKKAPVAELAARDISDMVCAGETVLTCSGSECFVRCWDAATREECRPIAGMVSDPVTTLALARRAKEDGSGKKALCVWGAVRDRSLCVWETPFVAHELSSMAMMAGPCVVCGKSISKGYHCELCDTFNVHKLCISEVLMNSCACHGKK